MQTTKNTIKTLMPSIFKDGFDLTISEVKFKDYANDYFKNKKNIKKVLKDWHSPCDLTLKFDDRLNMFFLYEEYDPVLGFYLYTANNLQIVPFRNYNLLQGIALLIDFTDQLKKKSK